MRPELKKACKSYIQDEMLALSGMNKAGNIAKYFIHAKTINGMGGGPRSAKTLTQLETQLTNEYHLRGDTRSIEFANCEFTEPAKKKMREFILHFLASHCSVTKIKGDNGLFDKTTQSKINEFINRNRQLYSYHKNVKLALLLSLAGVAAGVFLYPLLQVIISCTMLSPMYYWLYQRESTKKVKPNNASLELTFTLVLVTLCSFLALGVGAAGLSLIGSIAGLTINYFRDNIIKNSIEHYAAPNVPFNTEEMESVRNGFNAQKGFTPLYWGTSTWKCPRAYYVGLYSSKNILENKQRGLRLK